MASSKGKLCVRSFPHLQFSPFTQALQQVSILATNILQKTTKLPHSGQGPVHLPKPFNHQIKRGL